MALLGVHARVMEGISDQGIVVCDFPEIFRVTTQREAKTYSDYSRASDVDILDYLEVINIRQRLRH